MQKQIWVAVIVLLMGNLASAQDVLPSREIADCKFLFENDGQEHEVTDLTKKICVENCRSEGGFGRWEEKTDASGFVILAYVCTIPEYLESTGAMRISLE